MKSVTRENIGHCWTGWPPRPILSIYWMDSELACRSRKPQFDLTDNWAHETQYSTFVRFGIVSQSLRKGRWTEEDLQRQEENIRYDLSEDGFIVQINRLKGLGLMRSEEALWELCIASV